MKRNSSQNLTQVQIFKNQEFGSVRTLQAADGQVLFVARDVLAALGYRNISKALADHVDKDDVTKRYPIVDNFGRRQLANVINESGLYALILSSQLTGAKAFKRWVTSEVLPQIRRTGGYIPTKDARTGERLSDEEIVQKANGIMQRTISTKNRPADGCLTTSDIAKLYGIATKDLNHLLVDKGVQFWNGSRYKLTASYADNDFGRLRKFYYYALDGEKKERCYLVWTPKGAEMISRMMNA